jgi:putative hydrolase of the HAD superfamily
MSSSQSLRRVRAVVFDAVGTLIHPDPPAPLRYAEVGKRYGSRLSAAEIADRFGAGFREEEEIDRLAGLRTSEEREINRWRHIVNRALDDVADPEACFQELFSWFSRPAAWQVEPETGTVLRELASRKLILGIASNYDRRLYSVIEGKPELAPAAGVVVISAEVGWRKPAAEFFEALCRAVSCPASEVLYVGDDRANDYDGASRAGLRGLLFDPRERQTGTDVATIGDFRELLSQ